MTPYALVYRRFLSKIEDKDLYLFSDEERVQTLHDYLDAALAYIELDDVSIVNDLTDRDDTEECFNSDLTNGEIELVAIYMVVAWYDPRINSLEHILLINGSKSEKWTSQKEHLDMMIAARENWLTQGRKLFRNYKTKNNDYLGEQ